MDGPTTAIVLFVLAAAVCCAAVFPAVSQLNNIPDSFKGRAWFKQGQLILLRTGALLVVAAFLAAYSTMTLVPHL